MDEKDPKHIFFGTLCTIPGDKSATQPSLGGTTALQTPCMTQLHRHVKRLMSLKSSASLRLLPTPAYFGHNTRDLQGRSHPVSDGDTLQTPYW